MHPFDYSNKLDTLALILVHVHHTIMHDILHLMKIIDNNNNIDRTYGDRFFIMEKVKCINVQQLSVSTNGI